VVALTGKQVEQILVDSSKNEDFDDKGRLTREARLKLLEAVNRYLNAYDIKAQATRHTYNMLVTHSYNSRVTAFVKKKLFDPNGRPLFDHKGRRQYARGDVARGSLHEESVYGKIKFQSKQYKGEAETHKDRLKWRERSMENPEGGIYTVRRDLEFVSNGYFSKESQVEQSSTPK